MRLLIFGPQGSGKGTYASRLSPILGIPHISTGELFRENIKQKTKLGKVVEGVINAGNLVSDEVVFGMLEERLAQNDAKKGFILDGYPRNMPQAEMLDKITKINAVINLVVPDEILIKRLSARVQCRASGHIYNLLTLKPKVPGKCDIDGSELYQRDDDRPDAIKKRLELYREQSAPLINYYRKKRLVVDIECNSIDIPPEIMVEKIMKELRKIKA